MLRIRQTNGFDFSTAVPTSPRRLTILPSCYLACFSSNSAGRRPIPTDEEFGYGSGAGMASDHAAAVREMAADER